jgi:type I restriction-modification system DNA methylase subunit/restriction endonuclease S subunit
MINEDNFKSLLNYLNFDEKANTFTKNFEGNGNYLKVNFTLKQIEYPELSGFIVNERQTCNFSQSENQVVFECVHRLLEKGYEPRHIELEPRWRVGRGASGGRADILVKDKTNKPLLLIECKTYGNEFNKAWKDTLDDGGQLFTYAQQISETEFLCLYASEFKDNNINTKQRIISHKDNENILEQDENLPSFRKATNVKNRYDVWKETYKLEFTKTGVFENNIQAYQIGKNKYTLENDTRPIISGDKKGKYHEFRTILRKYNIARKETAFEVLVNLFLAKLVDEEENKTDLNFYWKGVAYDDYYTLMDRLQQLYQIGMFKFLNDEIMYISDDKIEQAFWTIKNKRNATKKTIQNYFRDLKYYSNNAFSFVNVHNKRLFEKNAKVLVEIIQMWQELRLKTDLQNQFLGDMFEFFLDNGIKQSEGQFFTPIPICKFIVMSLPLEKSVELSSEPLHTIDFACGSGHFLNEYAHQIRPYIEKYKSIEFAKYLENTYGIEKEDRLAKVAKVSAYMYGQGQIKILEEDALDDLENKDIKPESFNFLIANPPFAVEGFLTNLSEKQQAKFELTEITGINSNTNNVQCFFIERAKQIMAPGGIVAIIVPSSVLSNSDAVHIATREIILKFFDIVSIAELPSGTFGKTGTNTVVLFLRRKDRKPEPAEHYLNRVEDYFDINLSDVLGGNSTNKDLEEYQDLGLIKKYCEHNELPYKEYIKIFGIAPESFHLLDELLKTEMFKDYKTDFDGKTEIKKLISSNNFKIKSKEQQTFDLNKRFIDYILNVEKDKLYYFMLASDNQQKVLIIKSPTESKEQKQFLGYEWSGSKGSEGIIYNGGETVNDINTPLFDPNNAYNEEKINFLILQNFLGERPQIENLPENCTYANLTDMLEFSRKDFNKALSLTPKISISINTKWDLVKLGSVCEEPQYGANEKAIEGNPLTDFRYIRITDIDYNGNLNNDFKTCENIEIQYILEEGDFLFARSGATVGKTFLFKSKFGKALFAGYLIRFRTQKEKLIPEFLNYITQSDYYKNWIGAVQTGTSQPNVNAQIYSDLKIPLPPLEVQQKIVDECVVIDKNVELANATIDKAKKEIEEKVSKWFNSGYEIKKIKDVAKDIFAGGDKPKNFSENKSEIYSIPVYSNGSQNEGLFGFTDIADQRVEIPSVTVSARGTLGYTIARNVVYLPIVRLIVINPDVNIINQFYLVNYMNYKGVVNTGANIPQLTVPNIKEMEIPVPPIEVQEQLVAEIEKLEAEIAAAKAIVASAPAKKQEIMERYL